MILTVLRSLAVVNLACFNLSLNIILESLLKSLVAIYLSWLGIFCNIFNFSVAVSFFN